MKIRALCPDATLIFMVPPSWAELERRVRASTSLTDQEIKEYLECAEEDILCASQYDYVLINDEVDKTVRRMGQIIHGNRYRPQQHEILPGELHPKRAQAPLGVCRRYPLHVRTALKPGAPGQTLEQGRPGALFQMGQKLF